MFILCMAEYEIAFQYVITSNLFKYSNLHHITKCIDANRDICCLPKEDIL